jgi:hypothetical protein
LLVGGDWSNGADAGLCFRDAADVASFSARYLGARPEFV